MSDTKESLDAILAEMRADVADGENAFFIRADWLALCDRIEAAVNRMRDAYCDLCQRFQEALEKAERRIAELERAPGNAAAMRETLEWILGFGYVVDGEFRFPDTNMVKQQVDAALAAPARNCDRFATLDEARRAFQDLRGHKILADVELMGQHGQAGLVRWLFAPAEGGAKCVNGLRGEPDCRGCNEHCEDVRKRNCFYWNPDIGKCALDGRPSCRIACDNFHVSKKEKPDQAQEGGAE